MLRVPVREIPEEDITIELEPQASVIEFGVNVITLLPPSSLITAPFGPVMLYAFASTDGKAVLLNGTKTSVERFGSIC